MRIAVLLSHKKSSCWIILLYFLDAFEYTFKVYGAQVFPNDTVKHSIVTEYNPSVYNLPSLQYVIMEHIIQCIGRDIDNVDPTRIDDANTRLDFQIYANNAEVTRSMAEQVIYVSMEITSAYGASDRVNDKMTIHIPYSVALQHLVHNNLINFKE